MPDPKSKRKGTAREPPERDPDFLTAELRTLRDEIAHSAAINALRKIEFSQIDLEKTRDRLHDDMHKLRRLAVVISLVAIVSVFSAGRGYWVKATPGSEQALVSLEERQKKLESRQRALESELGRLRDDLRAAMQEGRSRQQAGDMEKR